jgi:hypothetical protein
LTDFDQLFNGRYYTYRLPELKHCVVSKQAFLMNKPAGLARMPKVPADISKQEARSYEAKHQ